ncbi:MAG: hypothetical protein K2K86_02430 [Muribaculaceae bacterium]|nr:hypothetical protein [Muribaculaceae bacterium]
MAIILVLIAAIMLCMICVRGCGGGSDVTVVVQPQASDSTAVTVMAADSVTATQKKSRRGKKSKPRKPKTYPERSPLDENIY